MTTAAIQEKRSGLDHWMQQVLIECKRASDGFSSDSVHDLRTSLRRCRSLADGIMVFDPDSAWRKMKRSGRELFSSLGQLRDTQVMQGWIEKLAPEGDPATMAATTLLRRREGEFREIAAASLQPFDRAQWSKWAEELPLRVQRVPLDSPLFAHLALERWQEARALHRRASRNRTIIAYHDLRIGIKRLRYTIENFLPTLHHSWGRELKELQDILGEVHDLDVLWRMMLELKVFADSESQAAWRSRIQQERATRIQEYRSRTTGPGSFWSVLRAALPPQDKLRSLGFERLEVWASFLDPDVAHSKHVARLALQIFDGLKGVTASDVERETQRYLLHLAAITHDVGRALGTKGHHKASARLLRRIVPLLGWTAEELQIASLVARYHRGVLPRDTHKFFTTLPKQKQALVKFLAGILRLACACDQEHDHQIRRVQVENSAPFFSIRAQGYSDATPLAQRMAAARYLLELACSRPVLILPLDTQAMSAA